ncbi:DUF2268 domain-containing protein [Psychrobacillus vulpis]|uniref:DUF2268 domain-containing protein n=1 Tax=Psychrobacillus vulpis TaxID=2325572 RepID=A0A544TNH0_9BACI|nr:DUF2268 domain-containing putative Zn-dependent protease [Psychrobacillus vulpis]TQR19002.1 hypothetical protein FG384_14360 [Psychrobacillus vulpis]
MPVIQTQSWLYKFVELCEEQSGRGSAYLQREILCEPLMKLTPKVNPEVWQYELLNYGLFEPDEWLNIKEIVKEMETKKVWQIVKKEYRLLKKLWNGPKVSIYIFPIKIGNLKSTEQIPKKNGVAFRGALFLFVSPDLSSGEIKALLAHEYNHVCRLNYLDLAPEKITLRDSLIIEGLGEYAVKDLYGEKWLGPWTNLYSFEEASEIWKHHFIRSLNISGVKNHQLFLYGRVRSKFPKWIGYHLGYQIVDTFQKKHGPFRNDELYTKSSEEIIAGSKFAIEKLL